MKTQPTYPQAARVNSRSRFSCLLVQGGAFRLLALVAPAALLLAGCSGNAPVSASNAEFSISPGTATLDTNCTGCNALSPTGSAVEQFTARLADGSPAEVTWSVSAAASGAISGPLSSNMVGHITPQGLYTPPAYLTVDSVPVTITATLVGNSASTGENATASIPITVTPGFFQPLTPENVAIGPNGTTTITGLLAEAGGSTSIHFALSSVETGSSGGLGSLSNPTCQRSNLSATTCSVVYTAPATLSAASLTYIVATVGSSHSRATATVLVNPLGITSSPILHQFEQFSTILLGSSGGHNYDYETHQNTITGCCGGTLGSLIEDASGTQYLLSNNHVLALSDQALIGDPIVQPALIDNDCSPTGISAIGSLTAYVPLSSPLTNVDAAIARVASGAVDPAGRILELGTKQSDGALAPAAPGISSTNGHGEAVTPAMLPLSVAKSGRTTGLTCANISAISLDVSVEYFKDCAETVPYLSKTFTNQLAISGNGFSDAGDSGALVVNTANAEPVALYFAGGIDSTGVSQGIANPVADVLNELNTHTTGGPLSGNQANYTFVGTTDHPVSCLSYGDSTVAVLQSHSLSLTEAVRAQQALSEARLLVNPLVGILGVATGKSNDSPGEAAVLVYVDETALVPISVPATIGGVRTQVIPTSARAVIQGSAPQSVSSSSALALPAAIINPAIVVKKQLAASLMKSNPAFFGVGVGQSLDNPREAALVIYVDRRKAPAELQPTYDGLRARYLLMDRMHVTRAYATSGLSASHCISKPTADEPVDFEQRRHALLLDLN